MNATAELANSIKNLNAHEYFDLITLVDENKNVKESIHTSVSIAIHDFKHSKKSAEEILNDLMATVFTEYLVDKLNK